MSLFRMDAVDKGIPRQLSVWKGDAHFDGRAVEFFSGKVAVFLDGVELDDVASWDVDLGQITRIARHDGGRPITDEQGRPARETLKGRVEVRRSKVLA